VLFNLCKVTNQISQNTIASYYYCDVCHAPVRTYREQVPRITTLDISPYRNPVCGTRTLISFLAHRCHMARGTEYDRMLGAFTLRDFVSVVFRTQKELGCISLPISFPGYETQHVECRAGTVFMKDWAFHHSNIPTYLETFLSRCKFNSAQNPPMELNRSFKVKRTGSFVLIHRVLC
jgi:hypothetical protein